MFDCQHDQLIYFLNIVFCFRQLSDVDYNKIADETLESLADTLEALADSPGVGAEFDVSFSVSLNN